MSQVSLSNGQPSEQANASSARLQGHWLLAARVGWVAIVAWALALCIISLPAYYQRLQIPCTSTIACQLNGALTSAGMRTLHTIGLSLSSYAIYNVVFGMILIVIWSIVGFIIFWRRSDEWIALLVALTLILFNSVQPDTAPTALAMAHPAWTIPVEDAGRDQGGQHPTDAVAVQVGPRLLPHAPAQVFAREVGACQEERRRRPRPRPVRGRLQGREVVQTFLPAGVRPPPLRPANVVVDRPDRNRPARRVNLLDHLRIHRAPVRRENVGARLLQHPGRFDRPRSLEDA